MFSSRNVNKFLWQSKEWKVQISSNVETKQHQHIKLDKLFFCFFVIKFHLHSSCLFLSEGTLFLTNPSILCITCLVPFIFYFVEKMSNIPLSRSEVFGELRKELHNDHEFRHSDVHVFIIMGASVRTEVWLQLCVPLQISCLFNDWAWSYGPNWDVSSK